MNASNELLKLRNRNRLGNLVIFSLLCCGLCSCSQVDPQDGFWNYPWGTHRDTILADSINIEFKLSREGFEIIQENQRLIFSEVQYGMGYAQVELDFTRQGELWHGRVRVKANTELSFDSIATQWRDFYGGASDDMEIRQDEGYSTIWRSALWLDRDFYSTRLMPRRDAGGISSIDMLVGGCLTECPLYAVRLDASGSAWLWSVRDKDPAGGFAARWNPAPFAALAQQVTQPEMLAKASFYQGEGAAEPTRTLRVSQYEFELTIESVTGAGPADLELLLNEIDSIVQSIEWSDTLVLWDTVGLGDESRIHLDSLQVLHPALSRPR